MDIDAEGTLHLDTGSLVGKSAALLGITGSGKTNTAAVLIEELLSSGLPLTIVDIEGEYYGIKQRHDVLVAGRSEHSELLIGPENAAQVAQVSLTRGISVILDLSEYTQDESYEFLVAYFTRLWEVAGKERKPYQIVLEEAHEFIPQGTTTPLKQMLTRIALRGRKRGLGMILMSQRSAKVEKDVLTQTSLLFLHKVVHPTDMRVYKDLIPLPPAEVEAQVGALRPGQVVVVHNHEVQVAHIRMRHTFHIGATPLFGATAQPALRRIDESMLRELQALMKSPDRHQESSEATLRRKIKELETQLAERDAMIKQQAEQIALLSQLSVTMNGPLEIATQMPEILHIAQARIDQATMHQVHAPGTRPLVVESEPQKPIPVATIAPVNEARVRSLQKRFEQLSVRQYQIFKLLVERGVGMTDDEIAAWLSVDISTVRRNRLPDSLFKIGLMKSWKRGNTSYYTATLKEYLAKEFPGTDQEELLGRLLGK